MSVDVSADIAINTPNAPGRFYGIGVGPGPAGYLPLAALQALQTADLIYMPRARGAAMSVAMQCLKGIALAPERIREIEFNMDPDRSVLAAHYAALADRIAAELSAGRNVAYLTIGDSSTYSTYGYVLAGLRRRLPDLQCVTFPGITSYAAAAAALGWPLGEGKERMLILPCPDDAVVLQADILTHDIVVLMKIGARLPWVLTLLREMRIAQHCVFARKIGLPGELLASDLSFLSGAVEQGYLATLLIRKTAVEQRAS